MMAMAMWCTESVSDFDHHVFPLLSLEWVSDELHRRGMRRLSRENRRRLSLVDCVSLEFMRRRAHASFACSPNLACRPVREPGGRDRLAVSARSGQ